MINNDIIPKTNDDIEHLKSLLEATIAYTKRGMPIIPLGYNEKKKDYKKPLIQWQKNPDAIIRTEEQAIAAFKKYQYQIFGIATITGEQSGFTILDDDDPQRDNKISVPPTPTVKTGRGVQYYFKYDPDIKNGPHPTVEKVDVLSGSLAILPPSKHHLGKQYKWFEMCSLDDMEAGVFPEKLRPPQKKYSTSKDMWTVTVYEGSRNNIAAKVCGYLHRIHKDKEDVRQKLSEWNEKMCQPSLEADELEQVLESITSYPVENGEQEVTTLRDKFYRRLVTEQDMTLFCDGNDETFVRFQQKGHYEVWGTQSKKFEHWLKHKYWKMFDKIPSNDVVGGVQDLMSAKAMFEGEQHNLAVRSAQAEDGSILYDLCDEDWRAIRITPSGWDILSDPGIAFRRYKASSAQVTPERNGDIRLVLKYVNLANEVQEILFLVILVAYFIPDMEYVISYYYGPQGSAKSSAGRVLRNIIDPARTDISKFPSNSDNFIQQITQHHLSAFDNISGITYKQSDDLCRAATGGSLFKRKLYSDDDQVFFTFKRPIVVNGINLDAVRADLLDRCILFKLERIPRDKRKGTQELKSGFESDLPKILGGCLDSLSQAMKLREEDTEPIGDVGRMAEFEIWGRYIAEAVGIPKEKFIQAVRINRENQVYEAVSSDPIGESIIQLAEEERYWKGTPQKLFNKLNDIYGKTFDDVNSFNSTKVAKSASAMMRKLNILSTPLKELGVQVVTSRRANARSVVITSIDGHS